jgi:hypothetical protein
MVTEEPFSVMLEIINRQKGIHAIKIISSAISYFDLEHKLAKILDIYPTSESLHVQYCFSTDNNKMLPLDLTSPQNLQVMMTLLRPLVVPPILANGHRSTQQMKSVTVHVFNKGEETLAVQNDKVYQLVSFVYQVLTNLASGMLDLRRPQNPMLMGTIHLRMVHWHGMVHRPPQNTCLHSSMRRMADTHSHPMDMYHRHQLTGDWITVEKLLDWLNIGKGMADLLIRYAEEDVELVKAGAFMMVLADGEALEAL